MFIWVKVLKNKPNKICARQPLKIMWSDMVCLSIPYHFRFFKGCLAQILLGLFLEKMEKIPMKNGRRYFLNDSMKIIWNKMGKKVTYCLAQFLVANFNGKITKFQILRCQNNFDEHVSHLYDKTSQKFCVMVRIP